MNLNRKWGAVFFSAVLALLVALANGSNALADDYRCTGLVGAISVDNLRVPQNATCTLNGTSVKGNISVETNATLHAFDVQVDGNIQADRAARLNVYAGSSVNGKIQIRHSGAADIQSVDINGDLTFDDNDLFLNAANNTIGGNLQALKNTGGVFITGNTIDGNLQCKENFPPPIGGGNIVHGDAEDQCAALEGGSPPAPTAPPPPPTHTPPAPTQTPPLPTQTPPGPVQTAPVANEDSYTLTGVQIHVPAPGILENDLVAGSGGVEVVLVRQPQHGAVTVGQGGDFAYQVHSGYFGADSFAYSLRSAGHESNSAPVQLTMTDLEAPSVQWAASLIAEERYDLRAGEQIVLEVQASDNIGLRQVTFRRWDAVNEQYITLENLAQPPFRITISADTLNPRWNQVFVSALDLAGNSSDRSYVWLYKLDEAQNGSRLYLPLLGKKTY